MKKRLGFAVAAVCAVALVACGGLPAAAEVFEKSWDSEVVEHKGFRDLGHYVIELPDYTDPSLHEKGFAAHNELFDHGLLPKGGCTAMAKHNSRGEVIMGRNMDLASSHTPVFVFKTTYGKYRNFCLAYFPEKIFPAYPELQKRDRVDERELSIIPFGANDCINEKGLYIESNLREECGALTNYGLHTSHGEKNRADGRPWKELRANTAMVPLLVSQNCATVKEALNYLKNSFDWYTVSPVTRSSLGIYRINMAFMIGDASGEFGLIEIANDEISYIPYQYGQANFYITPKWSVTETSGSGHGRLSRVAEVIASPDTLEEAMDAMKALMWHNEVLWVEYAVRASDPSNSSPRRTIVFQDDKGRPVIDWRGDEAGVYPVMDDGRVIVDAQLYEDAVKSTYDPKIREYFDEAVRTGRLVIDDGSFRFQVNGRQVTLTELAAGSNEYLKNEADAEKRAEFEPYFNEYARLKKKNQGSAWAFDDRNFEALKALYYAHLHIRRNADGVADPSCKSLYEQVCAFKGHGVPRDEKPLRDSKGIWSSTLNVGVNCAQKEMKVRIWENDELIYRAKF